MRMRKFFYFQEINPVIRIMIFSDIMTVMSRFGLVAPVFAIFITDKIPNANLETVGIATMIYMITKSLMQIPCSAFLDKIKGEIDDFWTVFIGTIISSIIPIMYIFINSIPQLFFAQFLLGLSAAAVFPSWSAIFTRHIDKDHEGMEWSIYFSFIDLGSAAAAMIGGFVAYNYGFNALFTLATIVSLIGSMFLFSIKKNMLKSS